MLLNGDIIVVVRDVPVTGYPEGYPAYTEAELEHLCQDGVTEATIRLVHEAKKIAGTVVLDVENAADATWSRRKGIFRNDSSMPSLR